MVVSKNASREVKMQAIGSSNVVHASTALRLKNIESRYFEGPPPELPTSKSATSLKVKKRKPSTKKKSVARVKTARALIGEIN